MTAFKGLAIIESAVLECKKRDTKTPELTEALDFLEPHIQPKWLVPQYRHALDGQGDRQYDREGQPQVLRPAFEGIRDSVRDALGTRFYKLKRELAATHDIRVKKEIARG